ncbi:MAG: serine/threonine protein kinase [Planctomycetota bacterium]|jgi:serine/threonine-protein kinase|nr:serine/threonine protein kinase [Planctomycetota bacterium]
MNSRSLASMEGIDPQPSETAYFEERPPVFQETMDITALLHHLEDATPSVIAEPSEEINPPARYIIGRELGSGSIGQVIMARDQHLGREVAIKVLHEGEGLSRDIIARFVAEAQITAQLEHPSVVPVHEIGLMPGGMPYFSMKLVKGRSLDDIINLLRIGDRAALRTYNHLMRLRLFQRICQGMAYAHAKGVVHRDLKPSNVMIGEYGEVQIMDWGLAKIIPAFSTSNGAGSVLTVRRETGSNNSRGSIVGTPSYMSPEQARGDYDDIGPRSDVFTLGLILAELMSLIRVYRRPGFQATLDEAKHPSGPVDIRKLAPWTAFTQDIDRVVRRATHPEIEQRHHHAGELSADIAKLIEERSSPTSVKRFSSQEKTEEETSIPLCQFHLPSIGETPRPSGFGLGVLTLLGLEAAIFLLWLLLQW